MLEIKLGLGKQYDGTLPISVDLYCTRFVLNHGVTLKQDLFLNTL